MPFSGPVFALAAACCLGIADFLGGMLSRRYRSMHVLTWSHLTTAVILAVVAACIGFPGTWAWAGWAVLAGGCSAFGMIAFYAALATGNVGVVSSLAALGTLIPVIMAIAMGEQPSPLQYGGIALGLAGGVLACGPELRHEDKHHSRAVWWGLFAAVMFGLMFIGILRGAASSSLFTQLGMRLTSSMIFLLLALVRRDFARMGLRDIATCAGVGILDTGGNFLMALAATLGLVTVAVVLSSLYPIVTIALAAILLKERLRGVQFWGVAAALTGVVLLNVPA